MIDYGARDLLISCRDALGQFNRAQPVCAGHAGIALVSHRGDEVGQLALERLFIRDVELATIDGRHAAVAPDQPPAFHLLCRVVHGQVGIALEDSDFAHAILADAARSDVGNAPRRELQPRVGDIRFLRQHRDADGLDGDHLGWHDRQHDIEVMNHQIEDDVDVEAAIGKRTQPMHFDETRMIEQRAHGGDGRVVALGVPDAEDGTRCARRIDHRLCLTGISRERLLHQHADAALQERQRHR